MAETIEETIAMFRLLSMLLGTWLIVTLSGCGDTCESVQEEIEEIGRSIQKDPQKAMDSSKELRELKDKLQEMGCLR